MARFGRATQHPGKEVTQHITRAERPGDISLNAWLDTFALAAQGAQIKLVFMVGIEEIEKLPGLKSMIGKLLTLEVGLRGRTPTLVPPPSSFLGEEDGEAEAG